MQRTISNTNAIIIDPTNKFTDNQPKASGKVTYNPSENLVTIEFPPARVPSDLRTLRAGHPSNIKAKLNARTNTYSITFNLTPKALLAFGKKDIKAELNACLDAIWEDAALS